MYQAASRREELGKLASAGARGIKVDFFESDKQDTIRLYLGILEDAAAKRLMVDFHGSTLPRGWERTYPNLMSSEGVRGAEMYQFDAAFAQYAPTHNTMLVFTRNVVGPMDYTPVTFSHVKNRHQHQLGPRAGPVRGLRVGAAALRPTRPRPTWACPTRPAAS
jgi:hypothetical protein